MTDTTLAGMAFIQDLNTNPQCAHGAYPEVMESEWVTGLIVHLMTELEKGMVEGTTPVDLAHAAEHAFITVAGAGVALGKALASEALLDSLTFNLEDVDWDSLPGIDADDLTGEE